MFASERLTGALLDRLTHHVHILEMNGDSYRLKQSKHRISDDQPPETPDKSSTLWLNEISYSQNSEGENPLALPLPEAKTINLGYHALQLMYFCSDLRCSFTPVLTLGIVVAESTVAGTYRGAGNRHPKDGRRSCAITPL